MYFGVGSQKRDGLSLCRFSPHDRSSLVRSFARGRGHVSATAAGQFVENGPFDLRLFLKVHSFPKPLCKGQLHQGPPPSVLATNDLGIAVQSALRRRRQSRKQNTCCGRSYGMTATTMASLLRSKGEEVLASSDSSRLCCCCCVCRSRAVPGRRERESIQQRRRPKGQCLALSPLSLFPSLLSCPMRAALSRAEGVRLCYRSSSSMQPAVYSSNHYLSNILLSPSCLSLRCKGGRCVLLLREGKGTTTVNTEAGCFSCST